MKTAIAVAFCLVVTFAAITFTSIGISSADGPAGTSKSVTFSRNVAPILFRDCTGCHRPGEAAPMSLLSYKDARPWARSIREKVTTHEMPPWHADPHYGDWANDRRLTQQEIDTITAWVENGAPEGDPKDLPPAPRKSSRWAQADLMSTSTSRYRQASKRTCTFSELRHGQAIARSCTT